MELSDVFEALVDWPKRLAGEEPFYRRLFERVDARKILDTACGTGQHAALFHAWGLSVEGADISPRMIERARDTFGEPDDLRWVVRGYDVPIRQGSPFDVALCVGNSLALAPEKAVVRRAIEVMASAVRRGGAVAVHLLNLWRFPEGPCLWQKCRRAADTEEESLIIKGVHRCGPRAYVELVLAPVAAPGSMRSTHLNLLCLEADELEAMFRQCGAQAIEVYGSYDGAPYEREKSVDLIITAIL